MRSAIYKKEEHKNRSDTSFFNRGKESFFSRRSIQPKLTIGQPGDKYEQEADRMADYVVNHSSSSIKSSIGGPQVQNKCAACEEKDKSVLPKLQLKGSREYPEGFVDDEDQMAQSPIQLKSNGGPEYTSSVLNKNLRRSKGGGSPLSNDSRTEMESSFAVDFSGVRIHTGSNAVQMNQELGAQAFTNGSDIYFNQGKYSPESYDGKHLLAHELTHVVQQGGGIGNKIQKDDSEDEDLASSRFAGILKLEQALDGKRYVKKGDSGKHVTAIQKALVDDLTYDAEGDPLPNFMIDGDFGKED